MSFALDTAEAGAGGTFFLGLWKGDGGKLWERCTYYMQPKYKQDFSQLP